MIAGAWTFVLYGATRLGEALCCDVTLVSPLRRNGRPQPRAAEHDGAVLAGARRRKETRYPELASPGLQRLVVLACEVGDLVRRLVRVRSLRAPAALRRSAAVAWQRRWWGLLGVALQRAVVSTLLRAACCGCGAGPRRRPRPRGRASSKPPAPARVVVWRSSRLAFFVSPPSAPVPVSPRGQTQKGARKK